MRKMIAVDLRSQHIIEGFYAKWGCPGSMTDVKAMYNGTTSWRFANLQFRKVIINLNFIALYNLPD
jgi:hypothetical protein